MWILTYDGITNIISSCRWEYSAHKCTVATRHCAIKPSRKTSASPLPSYIIGADTLEKHGQLGRSKVHLAVTGDRPDEAAPLRAFGEEAQPVTVSPQNFYLITPAPAEDEQVSGERGILQDVLNF